MQTLNAVRLAQELLLPKVSHARCIVDATAGNGKDTLFLAKNSPEHGTIYAFDIQENAIETSKKRLMEHNLDGKVQLILDSHANIRSYINKPIDVAMFNLGYLPGKCHETMTMVESTIRALTDVVSQLSVGGIISVVAYPGHHHGKEENDAVRNYTMTLQPKEFTVLCIDMINHLNHPPILYMIEKIKSESERSEEILKKT
ncbi:class I SAM-dependent methyltransferase [Pelosinus sp. sgz500959]|uniref:class I SAM-dependent methyltransferase n=1 Tax=Pelosinus sp. sgz500959 TaxID=3242472 RepID=UPI00366C9E5A